LGPGDILGYVAALTNFRNPGPLVLDRLGLQSRPYRIKTKTGLEMTLHPDRGGDRFTLFETFGKGVYDEALAQLGAGDVVIDVGANIGCFTLAAWQAVGPKGTVLALEPQSQSFVRLSEHLSVNEAASVTPLQLALADDDGSMDLFVPANQYLLVSKFDTVGGRPISGRTEQVSCMTLASLMDEHRIERVSLLKLDCEGAEHEIIAALTPETASKIDHIAAEVHSVAGWDTDATMARLQSLGFEHRFRHTHLFTRRRDPRSG